MVIINGLEESVTYQAIFEEGVASGEAKGFRYAILVFGRKRFGEPNTETLATLQSITVPETLERVVMRLLEVESWDELVGGI